MTLHHGKSSVSKLGEIEYFLRFRDHFDIEDMNSSSLLHVPLNLSIRLHESRICSLPVILFCLRFIS
jgi:hypothetical protein